MERHDLKIGNVVNEVFNTTEGVLKVLFVVDCLHANTVANTSGNTASYKSLEGIPVTEDFMNDLGFEKYNECFYRIKIGKKISEGWYLSQEGEVTKCLSEINVRLKYVHRVQNLLYDLRFTS